MATLSTAVNLGIVGVILLSGAAIAQLAPGGGAEPCGDERQLLSQYGAVMAQKELEVTKLRKELQSAQTALAAVSKKPPAEEKK